MLRIARRQRHIGQAFTVLSPLEAEAGLLGAILEDNEQACRIQHWLKASEFRHPIYRWTYEAALDLMDSGEVASPLTLAVIASSDGVLDVCGGIEFFDSLLDQIPQERDLEGWAMAIHDRKPWRNASPARPTHHSNCKGTGWN